MAHEYRPAPMSLAQRAALRSQQPRMLRQPAHRRVYPLVIALALLVILVAGGGGFEYYYRDRIFPRVHLTALDLDLSGMTQAAVAAKMLPFSVRQRLRTIALMAPGHAPILVDATTLGYRIDRGLTAYRAYIIGHESSIVSKVKAQATLLAQGATVAPAQSVDQLALREYLFRQAPAVNRRARPGHAGRRLDVAKAQRRITGGLLTVVGAFKVYLPFVAIPAPAVHHTHRRHVPKHRKKRH